MVTVDSDYKNYLLLYIDLLGTKERIINWEKEFERLRKDGISEDEIDIYLPENPLNTLQNLFKYVQIAVMRYECAAALEGSAPISPKIVVFSDNIAVALEIPDDLTDLKNYILYLLQFAGEFQCNAIADENGWLTRGCLTAGKLFVSNTNSENKNSESSDENSCKFNIEGLTVSCPMPKDDLNYLFGPAIVRADFIEREIAIYPRIIIDDVPLGDSQKHYVR